MSYIEEDDDKKKKEVKIKTYTYKDINNFNSNTNLSAFGKIIDSTKLTNPIYGFGKGTRNQLQKVYQSKKLLKSQFLGKTSPGPNYIVTDKFDYISNPKWTIGGVSKRSAISRQRYDYYDRFDALDVTNETIDNVKLKSPIIKFGTEKKVIIYEIISNL